MPSTDGTPKGTKNMFGLTDYKGNPYYHQHATGQAGQSVVPIVNLNNPDNNSGIIAGSQKGMNTAYGADKRNFIGVEEATPWYKSPVSYITNPGIGMLYTSAKDNIGALWKRRQLAKGFKNLDTTHGMTLSNGQGVDYQVSPETMNFVNVTRHIYSGPQGQAEANVRKDVADWIDKQGKFKQLTGMQGSFDNIQRDLNAWQQHAMWQLKNGTPEQKKQAQMNLQYIANAQYTLNKTVPEFNRARTATLNQYKQNIGNFAGNNWWWMLPAGGALLYGLGNLFGRGGQQAAQPGQSAVPMPSYWKTGFQTPKAPVPQTQPNAQGF